MIDMLITNVFVAATFRGRNASQADSSTGAAGRETVSTHLARVLKYIFFKQISQETKITGIPIYFKKMPFFFQILQLSPFFANPCNY